MGTWTLFAGEVDAHGRLLAAYCRGYRRIEAFGTVEAAKRHARGIANAYNSAAPSPGLWPVFRLYDPDDGLALVGQAENGRIRWRYGNGKRVEVMEGRTQAGSPIR